MAIAKKYLGTNESGSNYYDVFKKWSPVEVHENISDAVHSIAEKFKKPKRPRKTKSKKEEK